jgi:hypothetical protein
MFCRLTLTAVLISIATAAASAQSRATAARISVKWENLPLADALDRIEAVTQTPILLDRRVDPERRIHLTATGAEVDEVLAQVSSSTELGHARIGPLFYVGPRTTADRLSTLAAERRQEVAALPSDLRRSFADRKRLVWPRLTEPRGLVIQLVEEHGWKIFGANLVPHDLWAAGELPSMALADQLTILLAGFDLTYRVLPDRRTIEIVPVRWEAITPRAAVRRPTTQPRPPAPGKQVFTLRVENKPVGKVLEQLAVRLGWKIDVDESAIRAAGLSLDRLVTFNVENADQKGLLEALLTPAGLTAKENGDRLSIGPK